MKILAKSILHEGQIETRKPLNCDGIEILLLGKELDNLRQTRDHLVSLADDFGIIGIEAPDTVRGIPVYPTSDDVAVREHSRAFLEECVALSNQVWEKTGVPVYFQYQYLYDRLNDDGTLARNPPRDAELSKVREYHKKLQRMSDVDVQMENTTPLCAGFGQEKRLYSRPVTARMVDFTDMGVPLALDIVHLAETLYTWAQAKRDDKGHFVVDSQRGKLYFPAIMQDLDIVGARMKENHNISDAITNEIVEWIGYSGNKYRIGSLQFANAQPGFAVSHENEGYEGANGLIDVPRVLKAIVKADIPYVIPEYREKDYLNPVNQRAAVRLLREISREQAAQ